MLFIKNGGLFIVNRTEYKLGDDVFILRTLVGEAGNIFVVGKVIWIVKKDVQQSRPPGNGIQFTGPDNVAEDKTETYTSGSLSSASTTNPMSISTTFPSVWSL